MKKVLVFVVVIIIIAVIYFTGLYTYFVRTDVQEALPSPSTETSKMGVLRTGSFGEVDFIHKGSGEAKIVQVDGKHILRLENFNVTSGPDLYVYLSKSETPTGDIKSLGDYVDLGLLKGTSGNQNYDISQNVEGYKTAVIWCKRYGVLFTFAVMK